MFTGLALFRSLPWWSWKDQVEDLLVCGTCFWQTAASVLNSSFICVWLVHFARHSCDGDQEIALVHTGDHLKPYLIMPGSGAYTFNGCTITWKLMQSGFLFFHYFKYIFKKNKTLGWRCVCWSFVGPFVVVAVRTTFLNEVAIWTGNKRMSLQASSWVTTTWQITNGYLRSLEAFFCTFLKMVC